MAFNKNKISLSVKAKLKLVVLMLILVCITFFIMLVVLQVRQELILYEQYNYQTSAVLADRVVSNMEAIEEMTKFPLTGVDGTDHFLMRALKDDNLTNYLVGQQFADVAHLHLAQIDLIETIAVYDLNGEGITRSINQASYYFSNCDPTDDWYQETLREDGGANIVERNAFSATGLNSPEGMVCVTRALIDGRNLKPYGIIVVGVRADDVSSFFDTLSRFAGQEYGAYFNDVLLFGSAQIEGNLTDYDSSGRFTSYNLSGEPHFSNYLKSDEDWTFVVHTPLHYIFESMALVNLPIIFLLLIILLLVVFVISRIINSILVPLNNLVNTFNRTDGSLLPIAPLDNLPKELKTLFSSFNTMNTRVNQLIGELVDKDVKTREMELQLLRTQINPHYLYNTLEFMHMQAYANKDYTVSRMTELLGQNLQYGLRNTTRVVTLQKEVEMALEYVTLIQYHYGDMLEVVSHFSEDILQCKTIKLMFQPLIENAVVHGREPHKILHIELMGYREGDNIVLTVNDDGKGIEKEQLNSIIKSLEDTSTQSTIGIYNVHRRIKLNYGEQYGVVINSIQGKGTTFSIILPYSI